MPYRILIVDDEEDIRKLLRLSLKKQYEVVEAASGEETLQKLDAFEPDLITIDVMMPDYSGFELCHLIRQKRRFEKTPIIMFSALSDKESHKGGYEAGANLYLTKSISPELFTRNVDFLISQSYQYPLPKKYTIEQIDSKSYVVNKPVERPLEQPVEKPPESKPSQDVRSDDKTLVSKISTKTVSIIPETPQKPTTQAVTKYRVVTVDDDENVLDILRLTLKDDYEVITAADGLEALTKINEYEPDIVLLDIMLPNFSGYQIKQTMDKVEKTHNTPVIFLTAKSDLKSKAFAEKMNPAAYITKPFDPIQLKKNIEGILKYFYPVPKKKKMGFEEIQKIEAAKIEARRRKDDTKSKINWDIEH